MADSPPPPVPTTEEWTQVTTKTPSKAAFVKASSLGEKRATRKSIYRVYFPICLSANDTNLRDPYKCVKHILAILSKRCTDLQILPKDDADTSNEPICLWSNFPTTKTEAEAYLFNVKYPGQNFGSRAGAVDFRAEFRVSCNSSVRWMKQNDDVKAELSRHRYTVSGRADGPTVITKPIMWIVGPDPDNCSIANLRALLSEQVPEGSFIQLEKHRVTCRPDHQKKVFVTHGLKVIAPASHAWTTHEALRKYLQETDDNDRPVQLRGIIYAGINSKDVTKVELAALITLQNKRLHQSAAVQVVNVWKIDTAFELSEALVHRLSTENLDPQHHKPRSVRDYIRANQVKEVTLRTLMYAVLDAREDIVESPIIDDYLRGKSWNLVCSREKLSGVTTFLEWFIGVVQDDVTQQAFAQICGCRRPHDPDQYPHVEFAKQYSPDQCNHVQTVYGCTLKDFMKEYDIPEEGSSETTQPPDYTRPPRETFRSLHHSTMNTVVLSRPTWASTTYEKAFDAKELAKNHFTPKRFHRSYAAAASNKTQKQPSKKQQQLQQQTPRKMVHSSLPSTAPTGPVTNEPSTLTPPTSTNKTANVVSPAKSATDSPFHANSKFVKNTEQQFLDLSREIMEIRTGRQAMETRVLQIERKSDKLSNQMQEVMKSTSKILAKLNDDTEDVGKGESPTATVKPTDDDDKEEYLTDKDLKKFRRKVENVLEAAFNNFGNDIGNKLANMEEKIHSRIDHLLGGSQTEDSCDESDIDMADDEVEILENTDEKEDSANSATPKQPSVTATGQSPLKKLKGDPSSDSK